MQLRGTPRRNCSRGEFESSAIQCPARRYEALLEWREFVTGTNCATGDDIGSKASAVNEGCQHPIRREILEVCARFTEPVAPADDLTDAELFVDEVVQGCISGFDISPVFTGARVISASRSIASIASCSINVRS